MSETRVILTTYGNNTILQAIEDETYVNVAYMAYGDGIDGTTPYVPTVDQTSLMHQLGIIENLEKEFVESEGFIYFTGTLYSDALQGSNFIIRELGLFDDNGGLLAIACIPDISRPDIEDGTEVILPISIGFKTSTGEVLQVIVNTELSEIERQVEENTQNIETIMNVTLPNKADIDLGNLNNLGEDRLEASRIYNVLENEDNLGYEKVKELRYSAYDPSKFSYVGAPYSTDDGIIYVSPSNYLTIDSAGSLLNNYSDWEIRLTITTGSNVQQEQNILSGTSMIEPLSFSVKILENRSLQVFFNDIDGTIGMSCIVLDDTDENTTYNLKFKFKDNIFYYYVNDALRGSETFNYGIYFTNKINVGISNYNDNPFLGSINAKLISIYLSDKLLFSGTKTGIDSIVSDGYTIVGSPSISDDGIASSFSFLDYLCSRTFNPQSYSWEIHTSILTDSNVSTTQCIIGNGGATNRLIIGIRNSKFYLSLSSNNSGWNIADASGTYTVLSKARYWLKVRYTGSNYVLSYSTNGINYIDDITIASYTPIYNEPYILSIGANLHSYTVDSPFLGYIDLNSTKFYINGKLTDQLCLKIPYIEAKTEARIVSSEYRYRVQDCYNRFGEGNYYVIDEDNKKFDLALPDIYGLIQRYANKSRLIGQPIITLVNTLLDDEIWLEGGIVSRTDYNELFKIYGTTWGAGDGSTTFKLPDFRGRAIYGWSEGDYGYLDAGLPTLTAENSTSLSHHHRLNIDTSNVDLAHSHNQFVVSAVPSMYPVAGLGGGSTVFYIGKPGGYYTDAALSTHAHNVSGGTGAPLVGEANIPTDLIHNHSVKPIDGILTLNTVRPPAIKVRVKTRYM